MMAVDSISSLLRRAALLAALLAGLAQAQAPVPSKAPAQAPTAAPPGVVAAAAAGDQRFELPLSQLLGDTTPRRLAGLAGELRLSLPMPALWQAREVRLALSGTVSRALTVASQFEVEVNGHVVGQFGLDGRAGGFRQEVAVPVQVLRDGFNDVRLSVAQHYTDRCEYPMAPELWTQLDLADSRFRIVATPRPVVPRLDRLDALFDKAGWSSTPDVSVLTATPPSKALLSAMGLVAQGIGQRYDYVPVRLSSGRFPADMAALGAQMPAGSRGAVLLGTFGSLASYLAGLGIAPQSGPVAAVRALPNDPTRFVLVLAAREEAELPLVAAAFAMQRMPWPDRAWTEIRQLRMPPLGSVTGAAATLKPSTKAFPLSALGYRTTTYQGMQPGGARLTFWNGSWQGRIQVRVHASYSSGMSGQSGLNVLANGALHGTIPLGERNGGTYENYAVSVPAGALRPGWNSLELQPVLVPLSNGGDCQSFFPGNLAVTIYDDSTVQSFGGSPLKRPDLALLARDGRPLPTAPVGLGMAVQLTDADDATVGAGMTLMGKLTQVFRGPLLRTALVVGEDSSARNRIWVGTLSKLPERVRSAAGLGRAGELVAAVPLIQSVEVAVIEGGDTLMQLRESLDAGAAAPRTLGAEVSMGNALDDHSIAATVLDDGVPVTLFTAGTPAAVQAGMHQVIGYSAWGRLRGNLAVWRPGVDDMRTVAAEDAPFSAYSLRGGLGLWVSQYPWWALLIVLSLLTLMVVLSRAVLAGYRRRHLPAQEGQRREDKGAR